jgi:hypothetical protein
MEELASIVIEVPPPGCKICGAFAVVWIRELLIEAPVIDDRGRRWARFKPGRLDGFCIDHKPKPEPIEGGLLC